MNKNIAYIITLFSFLIAQIRIDGNVYDVNKNPIHNVQVYLSSSDAATTTDSLGYFILEVKENDHKNITFSHIAYIGKTVGVKDLNLPIVLEEKIHDANEVFVNALGYNTKIKDSPVITQIINKNDIERASYSTIHDIIEFTIPNVQKVHDPHGNDRVKIQGLDNKFLVFLIDGNRVSAEFAGNIDFSLINVSDIERIEYTKGSLSSIYGSDAVGGVINIITKKNKAQSNVSLSYNHDLPNIQTLSFGIGLKYNRFQYKLNLNGNRAPGYDLTKFSPLSKTVEENNYYNVSNQVKYVFENGDLTYINKFYQKEINRYASIFNINTLEYDTVLHQQNPRYYDYFNSLNLKHRINDNLNYELSVAHEEYNKSFYFPYYYSAYPQESGETKTGSIPGRTDLKFQLRSRLGEHFINFGLDVSKETYQSLDILGSDGSTIEDESVFSDEDVREVDEYSIFISDKFLYKDIDFVLGNRFTKYSNYNWYPVPFLSIRYPLKGYNFRLNCSRGYRVPGLKEMFYNFLGHSPAIFGNPNLKPSLSNHISLSMESRLLDNSYIELYINDIYDMISINTQDDGMYYVNSDNVTLYGINTSINRSIGKYIEVNLLYSFTSGSANSEYLLDGISSHSINSKLSWNFYDNYFFIISNQYNSSKNIVMFDSGEKTKLDGYGISNLILIGKWKGINIKFGIKNIFNYLDPMRLDSNSNEYLNTVDPGRRLYFNIGISY